MRQSIVLTATAGLVTVVPTLGATQTEPEIFAPGVVSTPAIEYAVTLTRAGDTAYFTRRASFDDAPRIWMATRESDGRWTDRGPLAISGPHGDEYPSLSPDGRRLYFASIRPLPGQTTPREQNTLWSAERVNGEWQPPRPVVVEGLEDHMASHPVVAADGGLYFHGRIPGGVGRVDAYRASPAGRGFGPPELLPFNSSAVDGEVAPSPAMDWVIFYSDREGGHGRGDLYVVRKDGEVWGTAVNVGSPINTEAWEWTPSLSQDGTLLYFARLNSGFDRSDLYVVPVSAIP